MTRRVVVQRKCPAFLLAAHRLLARNAGRVLPSSLILDRVWPEGGGSAQGLWEYVRRLRQKLGDDPENPRFLESERGIGYRLKKM